MDFSLEGSLVGVVWLGNFLWPLTHTHTSYTHTRAHTHMCGWWQGQCGGSQGQHYLSNFPETLSSQTQNCSLQEAIHLPQNGSEKESIFFNINPLCPEMYKSSLRKKPFEVSIQGILSKHHPSAQPFHGN